MKTTTKPAAIYARYSTDRQNERSIDDQERNCRKYADARGLSVVSVFHDAAMSGATLERSGFQALLSQARSRGCPFAHVIVDDLSRLSRDLGDTWNIIFNELEGNGIVLEDVTTGMSSDNPAARATFGALALVNDMARQSVRRQTRRGLEGLVLAGLHPGGKCYGYKTVPGPDSDGENRKVKVIEAEEAKVVRRIFEAAARGEGSHALARTLNREEIPAPYDKMGYRKPAGHGWSHTTIRNILRNEHYIGIVTWGTSRWDRRGKFKRRRPRPNEDEQGVIRKEYPKLRIIPQGLWDRVQARLGEPKRLGVPRTVHPSALSDLLECGVCGNNMSFVGSSKGGSGSGLYRNIKCSANHSKGPEICPNGTTISEGKMVAALAALMRSLAEDERLFARFEQTFNNLRAEHNRAASAPDPGTAGLAAEIRKQEAKVERLAELVATNQDIEALLTKLRAAEGQLRDLRARRAAITLPAGSRSKVVPAPAAARLRALFEEVEAALHASPELGQVALHARLGKITLTPREVGGEPVYALETTLKTNPAALVEDGRKYALTEVAGAGFEPATFGL
jgi:site-specific DNA recombinase